MHLGKELFLEYVSACCNDLDRIYELVEDIPDADEPTDDYMESFLAMRELLANITGRLLPMSFTVMAITAEYDRRQAERN